jgi:insertion element IS1 protein InsB
MLMDSSLKCRRCNGVCIKNGKSKNGTQRYYCKPCKKSSQVNYIYNACAHHVSRSIASLTREGCGIRSIARLLQISRSTVMRRIRAIARSLVRPFPLLKGKEYQLDEMRTFIGTKKRLYWIVYAIEKTTKQVVDFKVGRRNIRTLAKVANTLLLSDPKRISTDRLTLYRNLLPNDTHHQSAYNINHIERKNLNVRTHLKRLGRRTICFSRSTAMLEACLRIYFWGMKWGVGDLHLIA